MTTLICPTILTRTLPNTKKDSSQKVRSTHTLPSHRSLIFANVKHFQLCAVVWNLGILKSNKSPQSFNMRFSHAYTSKQILQHRTDLISGEIWLGLETLHKLTSVGSYSLHILIKDFDQKTYVAVYDQFKVIMMLMVVINDDNNSGWTRRWLCADTGRVQQSSLHPWRLFSPQRRWKS